MKGQSRAPKRVPQRTCAACRITAAKRTLYRLVRLPEGGLVLDPSGKRNGRGAYLCDNPACWHKAISSEILGKALRMSLSESDRATLQAAMPTVTQTHLTPEDLR
jgi:hypothetical protein